VKIQPGEFNQKRTCEDVATSITTSSKYQKQCTLAQPWRLPPMQNKSFAPYQIRFVVQFSDERRSKKTKTETTTEECQSPKSHVKHRIPIPYEQ